MSRGEVAARVQETRGRLLHAGYSNPDGLARKALDMLTFALRDCGRTPTVDELIQASAMFSLAAERLLEADKKDPSAAGEAERDGSR